jgi:hypothetical protein
MLNTISQCRSLDSHTGGYEELSSRIQRRVVLRKSTDILKEQPPASGLCLQRTFTLVSCSSYSTNLKMDAIYSSETSVDFYWTTRRNIQKIVLFIIS